MFRLLKDKIHKNVPGLLNRLLIKLTYDNFVWKTSFLYHSGLQSLILSDTQKHQLKINEEEKTLVGCLQILSSAPLLPDFIPQSLLQLCSSTPVAALPAPSPSLISPHSLLCPRHQAQQILLVNLRAPLVRATETRSIRPSLTTQYF